MAVPDGLEHFPILLTREGIPEGPRVWFTLAAGRRRHGMIKALSVDARGRVVAAVEGGLSRRGAAERFGAAYQARFVGRRRRGPRAMSSRDRSAATSVRGASRLTRR